ncbi:MAG: sensor histidine kinase [Magnetococcales bacterium]|nr:sensor histidine kinase [Magnetococcales bacterium]
MTPTFTHPRAARGTIPAIVKTWLGGRWNLGTRLILGSGVLFLAGMVLIVHGFMMGIPWTPLQGRVQQQRTETLRQLELIANLHKEQIEAWLLEKQKDIGAIASNRTAFDELAVSFADPTDPQAFHYLQSIAASYPEFELLELINLSGETIISSIDGSVRPLIRDRFVDNVLLANESYTGRAILMPGRTWPLFRVGHPIHDRKGNAVAILVAAINPDSLLDRLLDTGKSLGETGEAILVNDTGLLLSTVKHPLPGGHFPEPMKHEIKAAPAILAATGHEGFIETQDYRGEPVMAAFRHIRINPVWGMGLVVKVDRKELIAPLEREVTGIIATSLILFFLLIVSNTVMIRKQTRLLHTLSQTAGRFSEENLSVRTQIAGDDEVGILGRSFDRMAQRIQTAMEEITAEMIRHRQTSQELSQANDELKDFAYIVSHDLRSPLLSVQGFTEELQMDLEALERSITGVMARKNEEHPVAEKEITELLHTRIPEDIRFIRSATTKMERLVNAILTLSRMGRTVLKFEPLDLHTLVENNVNALGFSVKEKGITITITIDALPPLVSDRFALEQIIGNLLSNAIKYLEPHRPGIIRIHGETHQDTKTVTLCIQDNGRGIATTDIPKIFLMFQRVGRQDTSGDGIGLSYVRTLIRRLGGTISCESSLGEGTVFRLTIPAIHTNIKHS